MNAKDILEELKSLGNESTRKTLMKHGAREPFFGVRIGDMKPIQKRIKKNYQLSLDLYDTGVSEAMYLAGLIADETKMTKKDLQKWAENAYWAMISEYTVPWVAAESRYGWDMGLDWIESDLEHIQTSGWATLSNLPSLISENHLDIKKYSELMDYVVKNIHNAPNRTRYTMNSFVISVGSYMTQLREKAIETAGSIGKVYVDMGDTSCKVPDAATYIEKMIARNPVPKLKKTVRC